MTFDAENIALSRSRPWLRIGHASGLGGDASPEFASPTAMIVRETEAQKQIKEEGPGTPVRPGPQPGNSGSVAGAAAPRKPHRFYGSVEPVPYAFDGDPDWAAGAAVMSTSSAMKSLTTAPRQPSREPRP
jgi:hypothetical protein